ncbi:MAG TPA: hypothetical protein VJA23_06720 [Candidatus Nanoarchaeia archaeon]|nr:hypothetical protein [Candidatus Nanoarchaeia archaeon]
MKSKNSLKIIGYFILFILILNLILFAFRIIGWIVFWLVILSGALFVYVLLPRLKKTNAF